MLAAVGGALLAAMGGALAAAVGGGLQAAVAEDDGGCIFSATADLEDAVTERRRFIVAWLTNLAVGLASEPRLAGSAVPTLGLARRTTGAGLVTGLRDLVRASFAAPRSTAGVEVAAALVVVSRAAALAELADDDTESQLDTDVLARDDFALDGSPHGGFVTINCFT